MARLEHITKAAKELNVSQPSLSSSIQRLEQDLGVPLFDRHGRNIKLNAFGRTFLRRIERAFLELEEGEREIADMAGIDRGLINLAVSLPFVLPDLLKQFLALYPNVRVNQRQVGSISEVRNGLENAEIDLCISTNPITEPDIEWTVLAEEEMCLSVPKGHRFASRESVYLIEAADESFVLPSSKYDFRKYIDSLCQEAGFQPKIAFELQDISAVHRMVEMGLGMTLTLPVTLGKRALNPDAVHIRIIEPVFKRTLTIAWNRKHYLSRAAKQFRAFVIDYFQSLPQHVQHRDR